MPVNWGPAEDVGNHDQDRPEVPLQTASLRLRTVKKGLTKVAQDRRAWGASVRDVVNSIVDDGSTRSN